MSELSLQNKYKTILFLGVCLILSATIRAQTISGVVQSANENQPLQGVTIRVKGTNTGTLTNAEGKYKISASENDTLIFSLIGFISQNVAVRGKNFINVDLKQNFSNLSEVVVVGYGTQRKANLTGSVASVSGKDLENRPLPNVGATLTGLSPNLNINLTGPLGGEPGRGRNWNIRGIGSINGNDAPLVLVHGVEMNIQDLNPRDIKSVTILKDAAAAAIYGSRAPFGVILITTKKGKKDGSLTVQYNGNLTIGSPLGIPHRRGSLIFATVANEASANAGSAPVYPAEQMKRIKDYINGTFPYEYDPDNPPNTIWAGRRVGNANYDFPHEMISNHRTDYKHNISVSGGNEKAQYYFSLGYYNEGSFFNYGYDDYQRYNVLANLNTDITDWLSVGLSTKYAKSLTDYPIGITTVGRSYNFSATIFYTSPITPIYNINGSFASPMLANLAHAGRDKEKRNNFLISGDVKLEPVKGWITDITYSYNLENIHGTSNPKPVMVELGTGDFGNVGKPSTAYQSSFSNAPTSLFNVVTSYKRTLENHYFKVLIGFEQREQSYTGLTGRRDDLITEAVPSISTAIGAVTLGDRMWSWSTQGFFGRLEYNYKHKYLIEFDGRYDGSSRFEPETRWGFFPSVSAGYVISEENFWKPLKPVVNHLKIRASYGSLGNQNVSNYLYISSIPVQAETNWIIGNARPPYASVPKLISNNLTWETVKTTNFGIDAGFLNYHLNFTLDIYNRKTSNMIGPQQTLPYTLGASTPATNNAALKTQGFELTLKWRDKVSDKLSYHVQLGLGNHKATILKYTNKNGLIDDWYAGKEVGEIWGYVSDGLIQTIEEAKAMPDQSEIYPTWGPGDMEYKDLDGNNQITEGVRTLDDHGDLKIIGNSTPRYNISFTGGLDWKKFDFYMQWAGIGKRDYFPYRLITTFWGVGTSWSNTAMFKGSPSLNYWRPADEKGILGPNTNAYFPKPYASSETYKNRQVQTKYLLNAGYLRLRFLEVGYSLSPNLLKRIFIKKARVYVSGGNLLTITSLPKAMDPIQSVQAYGNGGFYPLSRSVSVGLNLTF